MPRWMYPLAKIWPPVARCDDCRVLVLPRWRRLGRVEWYVVHDEIWDLAGMPSEDLVLPSGRTVVDRPGYLCILCLERRLHRRLTPADFTDCILNRPDDNMTPRLADRLGYDVIDPRPRGRR